MQIADAHVSTGALLRGLAALRDALLEDLAALPRRLGGDGQVGADPQDYPPGFTSGDRRLAAPGIDCEWTRICTAAVRPSTPTAGSFPDRRKHLRS